MSEIITVERRRRWSDEDKRRIVGEALAPAGSVNAVAKRYGLHPSQIFSWRRRLRDGSLKQAVGDHFASVVIGAPAESSPRLPAPRREMRTGDGCRIEIVLGRGRRVLVGSNVDVEVLRLVIDVLEHR